MPDTDPNLTVIAGTGEVIDLANATTTDLADAAQRISDLAEELALTRRDIVDEVARRLDLENRRTVDLAAGERIYTLTTNAPAVEEYPLDRLEAALDQAAEAGLISRDVIDRIIRTPDPKPPEPRVDKRELAKLVKRPELERIVAGVRVRKPQNRTLKIEVSG